MTRQRRGAENSAVWEERVEDTHVHSLSLRQDGGYETEDSNSNMELSVEGGFFTLNTTTLAVVCACAAATVLICIIAFIWYKKRNRRQKLLHDLTFDECLDQSKITKSAPASRTPSPKLSKRMSCPDSLNVHGGKGVVVRSMTADKIPDFSMPPERVQPYAPIDQRNSPHVNGIQRKSSVGSIGSIRSDLYHQQDTSSPSEDDDHQLPKSSHGRIWYSVVYDDAMEQLHVTLVKVKDLPGRSGTNGNNYPRDPFVKIFLLPDDKSCRTSKSKKKTLTPVYNETHSFQVNSDDIQNRVIRFSVYDVDRRRVLHSLGHAMVHLRKLDLQKGDTLWSDLEPTAQAAASLGEIQLSLAFYPQNDKIRLGIHRAKNLHRVAEMEDISSYVRVQLYYGHKSHRLKSTRVSRQQTGSSDHSFNETLSFTVSGRQLDQCSLTVSLMVVDPRAMCDTEVGRVTLGPFMYARGEPLMHWQDMVARPRAVTTRWHVLTSLNSNSSSSNPSSP